MSCHSLRIVHPKWFMRIAHQTDSPAHTRRISHSYLSDVRAHRAVMLPCLSRLGVMPVEKEIALHSGANGASTVGNTQLLENVADVALDGVLAQHQ